MPQGQEIVVAPFSVYLADLGAAFPDVDEDPDAAVWGFLGDGGDKSMGEDGLTITHTQTVDRHRTGGRLGPAKATRSSEDLMIAFDLVDMTLEVYAKALSDASITTVAAASGTVGVKSMGIAQGPVVAEFAALLRGDVSPYVGGFAMQYEIPRVVQVASPAPGYNKASMAMLRFEFEALETDTGSYPFGEIRVISAAALP